MREYKTNKCNHCEQVKIISARGWCRSCYSRFQKTGSVEYKRTAEKKECIVDGCVKYSVSHGYCDMHRKRLAVHGKLESTRPNDWGDREKHPLHPSWIGLKRHRNKHICKEWHDDFWKFVRDVKDKPSKNHMFKPIDTDSVIDINNYHWVEKVSTNNEVKKAYSREWARKDRELNPRKYKDKSLIKYYGIGIEEYEEMQEIQDNKCAICDNHETALNPKTEEPRDLAVDHCHSTGNVRGLLCSQCNTAIGLLKDDVSILQKAIVYLTSQ